jgi:hypothetical protein
MLGIWAWRPERWRAEAAKYAKKAEAAANFERRERYSELAALCLEKAQRLEFDRAERPGIAAEAPMSE